LVEENSEAEDEAMIPGKETTTPIKVQPLQRTLYRKAKQNICDSQTVNNLGKPDAGNPPVRFDEGRGVHRGTDNCGRFNPHC
jgi:hypothetical protein